MLVLTKHRLFDDALRQLGNHISENTSDHIVVDIHNIKKSAYGKGADGQYCECISQSVRMQV